MSVTQTIEVPASHRLVIDVPSEVPAGPVILTFTPAPAKKAAADDGLDYEGECPICAAHNYMPNAETIAAIEEGRAMMRGEIPAKWYTSTDEMFEDLDREDPDDMDD